MGGGSAGPLTQYNSTRGAGGVGGGGPGGQGTVGTAGTANTGGGGGGGGASGPGGGAGGAGGSGTVIIRYPGIQRGTGGTVTFTGLYTVHTFTTSGTFTA